MAVPFTKTFDFSADLLLPMFVYCTVQYRLRVLHLHAQHIFARLLFPFVERPEPDSNLNLRHGTCARRNLISLSKVTASVTVRLLSDTADWVREQLIIRGLRGLRFTSQHKLIRLILKCKNETVRDALGGMKRVPLISRYTHPYYQMVSVTQTTSEQTP